MKRSFLKKQMEKEAEELLESKKNTAYPAFARKTEKAARTVSFRGRISVIAAVVLVAAMTVPICMVAMQQKTPAPLPIPPATETLTEQSNIDSEKTVGSVTVESPSEPELPSENTSSSDAIKNPSENTSSSDVSKNPSKKSDPDYSSEPACEHEAVIDAAVEATCTTTGKTEGSHCVKCGEILVAQEVIPVEHVFVDGKCTRCGAIKVSIGLKYSLNADGEFYSVIGIGSCTDTDLLIPSAHPTDGKPVTSIGEKAFFYRSGLISVTVPDSVSSIGYGAFTSCSGLTSITYNGTVEQWKAISKGNDWKYGSGNFTVYCADGEIAYEDA